MTEQVQEALAEVDSAPAPEATAAPENAQNAPEVAENQPEQTSEEKKFTQAEIDAMISKRLAREQRKWEREQKLRVSTPALSAEPPQQENFASPEAYAEALAERKAAELLAKREAERQQAEVLESYHEREEEARNKYEDFEQVAYNPRLPITQVMAESIQASEIGPEVADMVRDGLNWVPLESWGTCTRPGVARMRLALPPVLVRHKRQFLMGIAAAVLVAGLVHLGSTLLLKSDSPLAAVSGDAAAPVVPPAPTKLEVLPPPASAV